MMYNKRLNMNKQNTALLLRRFAGLLAILTLVPVVIKLVTMELIPARYLWVALPIYVLITLAVALAAMRAKFPWKGVATLAAVIAIILSVINISVYITSKNTTSFLSSLEQPRTTYIEYSIVAKSGSGVSLDSAKTVSLIASDPAFEDAVAGLAKETKAQVSSSNNLTMLLDELMASRTDVAVMRTANLSLVQENSPDTHKNLEVLGTYKIKTTHGDAQNIDVSKPFVVYVSGMDTYGDINSPSRSDVNMLLVVNPKERKLLMVNTPRDYYVQLHGTTGTKDKLTHAGVYGVNMSQMTLADLYGVDIVAYMRLNFTSLVRLVDAVGPIEVYSPHAFKSFNEGYNTLDSARALEFARERYSFADGDRERGRNQQRVIEAIIARLSEPKNIVHYNTVLKKLQGSLQTDISNDSVAKLVNMQLNDLKRWQVESVSVDGTGATEPTYSMGAQPLYVMIPDQESLDLAKQKIVSTLEE